MEKPGLWRLQPAVVTKPWGLVHPGVRDIAGIEVGVGELWLASAQTGPGNYSNTVVEPALRKTLAELLRDVADSPVQLQELLGEPVLLHLESHPHRGKTEAWHVRLARGRTGVAAGPRTDEDAAELERIITTRGLPPDVDSWSDEVRGLFGLVTPLKGGEVFVAPAGVLHTMFAIGPESMLAIDEIQQGYGEALLPTLTKILLVQDDLLSVQVHPGDSTVAASAEGLLEIDQNLQENPTVRVYDFGRRPGEYPRLGFELVDPNVGLRLAEPVSVQTDESATVSVMVADAHFSKSRVSIPAGQTCSIAPQYGTYHVLHCRQGRAELQGGHRAVKVQRGDTVFVPACLEEGLRIRAKEDTEFFDDTLPDLPSLSGFLARHGATPDQIEALLNPARVETPA